MDLGIAPVLILVGLLCLGLGWCAWRFLSRPPAQAFIERLAQALGLLALSALVASLVQLVAASSGWIFGGTSFTPLGLLAMWPVSWLVLCGGWSVQAVFEETAKELTGHRRDTLMDNWHVYAALTACQMLLLAALIAWRWRSGRRSDPLAWTACALVVANGIAGMAWPWWGT